jgi:CBS domain-containing protein
LHGRNVSPDRPLSVVAATMVDSCVDVVPVIGSLGTLQGLVTATDVLRAVAGRVRAGTAATDVTAGLFRLEPLLPPKPPEGA